MHTNKLGYVVLIVIISLSHILFNALRLAMVLFSNMLAQNTGSIPRLVLSVHAG